jgi:hypothetical protein
MTEWTDDASNPFHFVWLQQNTRPQEAALIQSVDVDTQEKSRLIGSL